MIVKINKIKSFGIFNNFSWDASINPFKKRNLIYGWNYSGKTTFSKLFSNLEAKNKIHFPTSEYSFEIEKDNTTFTQEQLDLFPYSVKVFNTFYIKNVFSWDKDNQEGFEPILFYLGDKAGDIQPKIDTYRNKCNPQIEKVKKSRETIISSFLEYSKDNGKFSKQATETRKYLNDQIKSSEFNKGHFINLVTEVKTDLPKYILAQDKVAEVKQQSIALNEFISQSDTFALTESLVSIGEKVKAVLEDSAPKSISLPELDTDKAVFDWVQEGVHLHKEATKCKFCDNDLSNERIKSLNEYYSTKLQEIQQSIQKIKAEIATDRKGLNFEFPHESIIAKHLQETYKKAIEDFDKKKEKYNKELEVFESDLKKKEGSYFNSIDATNFITISLDTELKAIIKIIKDHNLFVENFDTEKKRALNKILRHYVAEYLTEEDYINKEKKNEKALEWAKKCQEKLDKNNKEITRLEALLKDTVKGQDELNGYLKIFLNRDDIKIEIEQDKFVLKRGDHLATGLSEGEKTAIAFAYFLTELKSLKEEEKLKETIVFFDDPISSLDSNHIFQVRSLIQHFFKDKEDYLQLFISTHNFEFFSVMLDSSLFKNENQKDTKAEKCPYYLINRTGSNNSVIKNLPRSLRSHKSEYAHIFAILKEYNEITDKDNFEFRILLPNALRRFLELYTLFKYPKGFCEVDERLKVVFAPEGVVFHNTKLYHWFSHQNQFEKVAHHDGKLIQIDEAISEVMKHVETNDKLHWEGLTGV